MRDVEAIETTHALHVQPLQERQDHAVVVRQRLRRQQRALALQAEVLIAGPQRRLPPRWARNAAANDSNRSSHARHVGRLGAGRPCFKSLSSASSRSFPQAFQPRAQHLPKRSKRDQNRPFSTLKNVMVGRARFELAVSWSQTRRFTDMSCVRAKLRETDSNRHAIERAGFKERPHGASPMTVEPFLL